MSAELNIELKHGTDFIRNFYVATGKKRNVDDFKSYASGAKTKVVIPNHEKEAADKITILDSPQYNGVYAIDSVIDDDNVVIDTPFNGSDLNANWARPLDISGYTVEAKIFSTDETTLKKAFTTAALVDGPGGHLKISMSDSDLDTIEISSYLWDLFIIDGSGIRTRLYDGMAEITGRG